MMRGGAWDSRADYSTSSRQLSHSPSYGSHSIGFRLCMNPKLQK